MGPLLRARSGRRTPATTATCLGIVLMMQSVTNAQQPAELIIHNGLIINENGRLAADIRIRGEKIVEIAPKIMTTPGAREIDHLEAGERQAGHGRLILRSGKTRRTRYGGTMAPPHRTRYATAERR